MKKINGISEKEAKHLSWLILYTNIVMGLIIILMLIFMVTLLYFALHN